MPNTPFENIVSKMKKVTKKPKNSKYYKKFVIIVNKHRNKLLGDKHCLSEQTTYTEKSENSAEKLLDSHESFTDDSGISYDTFGQYKPLITQTEAIIEPLPKKFLNTPTKNKNAGSTFSEKSPECDYKPISMVYEKIEEFYNKEENDKFDSYCEQEKRRRYSETNSTKTSPFKRLANLSMRALSPKAKIPPKKPPRLHLKLNFDESLLPSTSDSTTANDKTLQTPNHQSLKLQTTEEILLSSKSSQHPHLLNSEGSLCSSNSLCHSPYLPTKINPMDRLKTSTPQSFAKTETNLVLTQQTTEELLPLAKSSQNPEGSLCSSKGLYQSPNLRSKINPMDRLKTSTPRSVEKTATNTLPLLNHQKSLEEEIKKLNSTLNAFQREFQMTHNVPNSFREQSSSVFISNEKSAASFQPMHSKLSSTFKSTINENDVINCDDTGVYRKFKNDINQQSFEKDHANEKFVVNIFESHQSKNWHHQSLRVGQTDNNNILIDPPKKMIHEKAPVLENENTNTAQNEIYFKMKKLRDIECVKMQEASNALRTIKNTTNRTWSEELLAESILLETDLRCKAIVNKILESKDINPPLKKSKISGELTLSNFQFEVVKNDRKKNVDQTTFFILAISSDTTVITTKAVAEPTNNNKLIFNDSFNFKDLDENFKIQANIYSITLNTAKLGVVEKFLKKKSKCCYPIKKIYFENVNTYEMQESSILKPSFTSCGEIIISKKDIGSSIFLMKNSKDNLQSNVTATITVNKTTLKSTIKGFLTLGKMDANKNIHYWERKWCSLIDNTFLIYNYPQDEEFDKPPVAVINLEYCFVPIVKNPPDCPRKRTFIIKTGRPSSVNDSNYKQLRRKNNFILNKYYLSADNNGDFEKWTNEIDDAISELDEWHRLIFKDEYYL